MTSESFADLPSGPTGDAAVERQSRIEELLLEGLDLYFAGKYERAITVWTRVAFLERGNGRARAYIERARSAQAEQQRQSEELLHAGVSAYHAGELQAARDLLTRSVEEGGPHETALVYLDRLRRTESAPVARAERVLSARRRGQDPAGAVPRLPSWTPTVVASAAVAMAITLLSLPVRSYLVSQRVAAVSAGVPLGGPLPVARDADRRIARARALLTAGRALDALRVLEPIPPVDPARGDVDRLRGEIQRVLLEGAATGTSGGRP